MNRFLKYTLGAAAIAGAAIFAAAPASAQVGFSIGIGPGYGGYGSGYGAYGPPRGFACDPYSRFYSAFNCLGRGGYGYGPSYYNYGPRYGFNTNRGWNNNSWRGPRNGWNGNGNGRGNWNGGGRNR